MIVTNVHKNPETLTMAVTAALPATAERAWLLWSDPRQLERWWGPPSWPATVVDHDLTPGGRVTYYMTGPEGEKAGGMWTVEEAEPPRLLVLRDAFADEDGNPDENMPQTVMRVTFADSADGVDMTITSTFASAEAMEQLIGMGMEEGMREAMTQIAGILVG